MPTTFHSAYHGASPPTSTGNSRLGAMTAGKRTVDCRPHARGGRRLRPLWRGVVHVAGRVAGPVGGEDGGAYRDRRRPPDARRRARARAVPRGSTTRWLPATC